MLRIHAKPGAKVSQVTGLQACSNLVFLPPTRSAAFKRRHSQHRWFSGRMLACHAGGPGSIPGRCNCFGNYVSKFVRVAVQEIALHKPVKHIRCGLVVRICGSHPQGRGSIPRNGSLFCSLQLIPFRVISPFQMSVNQKSVSPSLHLLEKVRPTRSFSPTFSTSWAFGRVKSTLIRWVT